MQDDKTKTDNIDSSNEEVQDIANVKKPLEKVDIILPVKEPTAGRNKLIALLVLLIIAVFAGVGYLLFTSLNNAVPTNSSSTTELIEPEESPEIMISIGDLILDTEKNYGNKYADGILPVGDGKYSTSEAKVGSIFACSQYASTIKTDNVGADTRGPWFVNNNTEYDINKKISVQGNKSWSGEFSNKLADTVRTITSNGLPSDHTTGTFPVATSDPAYSYDKNPNMISSQDLTYKLSASPVFGEPKCIGGEVGVMLSGVSLFNGFDAGARDAGAWEVQDACEGHPQITGHYHYHTLSSCIENIDVDTVIGFAIDGFPITGPKVGDKNFLTTSDLDACHGITSEVTLDGKKVTTYHYVMTMDFPYSVSCLRGTAGESPGTGEGQQQNSQNVPPSGGPPPQKP